MNSAVFDFFYSFSGKWTALDWMAVLFAEYFPYVLFFIFIVFIFFVASDWQKRFWVFSIGAMSIIMARGIFGEAIKFFGAIPRPFEVLDFDPLIYTTSFSFPSGHAVIFFALSAVVWFFNNRWGYWFFASSLIISLSRVFSGIHWPADVTAGIALGLVSFWLVWQIVHATIPGADRLTEKIIGKAAPEEK